MILLLQLLLGLGYTVLAHLASLRHDEGLALGAVVLLIAMLIIEPLLARRWWAFALLPVLGWGAWALHASGHAALPLLLVPVVFVLAIAWVFARTLRAGSVPLITRIVVGLEGCSSVETLEPALRSYTRSLTLAWAIALCAMAVANLVLALLASPGGLLDSLGVASPLPVSPAQWSWWANLLTYGVIGGFFAVEFAIRKRRFPGRYPSFLDFLRRLGGLGPAFWRDLLR